MSAPDSLLRYLRLYGYFVRFSVSRVLQYRFDFYFRVIMDLLFYLVQFAFYRVIFLNTPVLAGWGEAEIFIFVAGYCMVDALQMTFTSNNLWGLSQLINRGDLDYYLVRPVSTLFFVSLRDFALNSFINLLCAAGLMAWAIARYPHPLPAAKIALYVALILNGGFLHYLMNMLLITPVFWTHGGGLQQIYWTLNKVGERPDRIFRGWVWRIFSSVLPFALLASVPARLLLEAFRPALLLQLLVVTAVFLAAVLWLWRAGLRAYSSASS